jgi:alanyl-tRNA synthetase
MNGRLYYADSYLTHFDAHIVEVRGQTVYLDRTAFYPASGGQLHDLGTLNGVAVVDVVEDEDGRIGHRLEAPLASGPVQGVIDWRRRFDFMQQHTGQHLLSAVFESMFGFSTLSVHFGLESSTVDLATPALSPEQIRATEMRANEIVWEDREVAVSFEGSDAVEGLRKVTEREGTLRIVTIRDLDRSACGGTHVRATGEIGPIALRRLDKIRGSVRVEFLCGARAQRLMRADAEALGEAARLFSSPMDEVPALVASLLAEARESGKRARKLAAELAGFRGRELYAAAAKNAAGRRVHVERRASGALDDEVRALAMAFTSLPDAVLLAVSEDPPSVLLSASEGAGVNAGELLKKELGDLGGRGGGNPRMAQGSLPSREALERLLGRLQPYL